MFKARYGLNLAIYFSSEKVTLFRYRLTMFFFHSSSCSLFAFFSSISMHYFVRLPLSCHEFFSHLLSFTIYSFIFSLSMHCVHTWVEWLHCRFDNRGIVVCFPAGSTSIYLLQSFQTASGAHPPTPTYPWRLSVPRPNAGSSTQLVLTKCSHLSSEAEGRVATTKRYQPDATGWRRNEPQGVLQKRSCLKTHDTCNKCCPHSLRPEMWKIKRIKASSFSSLAYSADWSSHLERNLRLSESLFLCLRLFWMLSVNRDATWQTRQPTQRFANSYYDVVAYKFLYFVVYQRQQDIKVYSTEWPNYNE